MCFLCIWVVGGLFRFQVCSQEIGFVDGIINLVERHINWSLGSALCFINWAWMVCLVWYVEPEMLTT